MSSFNIKICVGTNAYNILFQLKNHYLIVCYLNFFFIIVNIIILYILSYEKKMSYKLFIHILLIIRLFEDLFD